MFGRKRVALWPQPAELRELPPHFPRKIFNQPIFPNHHRLLQGRYVFAPDQPRPTAVIADGAGLMTVLEKFRLGQMHAASSIRLYGSLGEALFSIVVHLSIHLCRPHRPSFEVAGAGPAYHDEAGGTWPDTLITYWLRPRAHAYLPDMTDPISSIARELLANGVQIGGRRGDGMRLDWGLLSILSRGDRGRRRRCGEPMPCKPTSRPRVLEIARAACRPM